MRSTAHTPSSRAAMPAPAAPAHAQQPERFMRLPEVITRTGLSRSTIYAAIQRGEFPASVSLGGRGVAWLESEIAGCQAARIIKRYPRAGSAHVCQRLQIMASSGFIHSVLSSLRLKGQLQSLW